eukprot:s4267_g2.t1
MFPSYACYGALQALPRSPDEALQAVLIRSAAAGREGPAAHAVSCCRRGRAHAVLAASAAAIALWRRQSRSKSLRPWGLCAQGDGEYMEEFDALGWDPGPKKRAASAAYGPSFSPEESLEELENLCGTLGVEVKERVLQQWRPTSGRMPIGSGKADELRQQANCRGEKQLSAMLWLHPVHLSSAGDLKPLRSPAAFATRVSDSIGRKRHTRHAEDDHSSRQCVSDPSDSPLRGELLGRLLDSIAGSDFASPRSSDTRDCLVTVGRGQLQVKSDLLDDPRKHVVTFGLIKQIVEPLFCISLILADVVSVTAYDLESAQGDLSMQVIGVAPRPPEAEGVKELDSSWAGADEAWILCSAASDTLVQLSMQGAVRWDWKDTFSTRHVLGTGSCGKVFAAAPKSEVSLPERLRGQDGCAVKVLSARIDQTSLRTEFEKMRVHCLTRDWSFWTEVLSLAMAAGHPNICGFAGVFCEAVESDPWSDGSPKSGEEEAKEESKPGGPLSWRIVLELLPGGHLFDSVSDHGVLQEAEAVEMLLGLLSAVAHLHSLRLVHRDVKAENVLFGRNRRPVLADFGISCSVDDAAQMQCRVGSPGYVAPEVVDVFGVGAVMYFAIDGQMVFRGSSLTQVLRRTGRCKISYATEPFGALSTGLLHLLQSLLAKSPGQRPAACTAFSTAWVLSPQQVRNGDIAKASMAALASKTTALEPHPSAARKGAPQLSASGSMNASTQTHRTKPT